MVVVVVLSGVSLSWLSGVSVVLCRTWFLLSFGLLVFWFERSEGGGLGAILCGVW